MARRKSQYSIQSLDPSLTNEEMKKVLDEQDDEFSSPLVKSILNALTRSGDKVTPLAFEEDPNSPNRYGGLYYQKLIGVPDALLKKISYNDNLVADILRARSNQMAAFGRELFDRHDTGFKIEIRKNLQDTLSDEKKKELKERVKKVSKLLVNCGHTDHWADDKQCSLSSFLFQSARNALTFGRFSTEIIWQTNPHNGEKTFHSFRPRDSSTIVKLLPKASGTENIRKQAFKMLQELKKDKLIPEKYENDEYTYIQVFEGRPMNVFTADEMIVHNCYPVTDVDMNSYPLTPIDTAISIVTTHINITTHNKLYFQQGRASRGMLVIQSDDVDPSTLQDLKQQFNAAINSVSNSWRMPLIKVGQADKVDWKPIDSMSRDGEFQFLYDSNARAILSAFQISPDELPGYSHLGKSTGTQTMSESNNEWRIEAHRDVGIRPLLAHFQDFFNSKILHLLDKEVAEYCVLKFYGLDSQSEDRELELIERLAPLTGTFDEIMTRVERPVVGKEWGGEFPLNVLFQQILDRYFTVGEIKEHFFGHKGASQDPRWNYSRDQFFLMNLQFVMQQQQMEMQQKMAQQQAQQVQKEKENPEAKDLQSGADKLIQMFSKSEKEIVEEKNKLREHHAKIVDKVLEEWKKDSERVLAEIVDLSHKNKK